MNMRQVLTASVVASALAVPAVTFAQQHSALTRAQVRAELAQLRAVGYHGDSETSYPVQIQAAEARVAARQGQTAAASSYGPGVGGSTAAGAGASSGAK
ncbi:DUF4148 domain-containing protein [Paraburkholderia solisilvae]|uniref:DUF4148 domain-containing protein n=1 Tax=Paraburkholderia solisilvae TaxID=624376 RepID=A0A6J5CYZ6_9BURK|nr:DUF4148 domain-containing protein [Paraburkholderia solisilvae]CAB3746351.1 hypothetical protein LMG29739_00163 [Paraburkholderia solisilvae]